MDVATPSFMCSSPGCERSFSSLDRLVTHASRDHVLFSTPSPSTSAPKPTQPAVLRTVASRIRASATPLNLILTLTASAAAQLATRSLRARVAERAGNVQVLESRAWGYEEVDVHGMFRALEEEGRSLYLALEVFDALISTPLAALFLSHVCSTAVRYLSYEPLETFAALFPFLVAFLKFAENNAIAYLLLLYPDIPLSTLAGASVLTICNLRLTVPIMLGLACSLVLAVPMQALVSWLDARYENGQSGEEWEVGETEREVAFDEYEEDEEAEPDENCGEEKKVR